MADVYEQNLGAKSSLTASDYIRVVGSDNVSYKNTVDSAKNAMGLIGFKTYNNVTTTQLSDTTYAGIGSFIISAMNDADNRYKWLYLRSNAGTTTGEPFYNSSFSILANCSSISYGWALLQSDNPNGGLVVGRLSSGSWYWRNIPAEIDAQKINRTTKSWTVTCSAGGYTQLTDYTTLGIARDKIVGYLYASGSYLVELQFATEGVYLFSHSAITNANLAFIILHTS